MDRLNPMRSRRTRVFSLTLVVGASLSLAACGRGETPTEPPPGEPAPIVAAPVSPPEVVTDVPATAAPATPVETPEATPTPAVATPAPEKIVAPAPAPSRPPEKPAAFASCGGCHSVEEGGRDGIGPNLFGVMGRQVGGKAGYAYSDAMAANGQTWTPALMDAFLAGPRDVIPGTKMMAAPVRNAETRQALIDYLSSLR